VIGIWEGVDRTVREELKIVLPLKVNVYHRLVSLQKQRLPREFAQLLREVKGIMAQFV